MCLHYFVFANETDNNSYHCGACILVGSCERLEHKAVIMKLALVLQGCHTMLKL